MHRLGVALALLLLSPAIAFAEPPPVVVFYAPNQAESQAARSAISEVARNRTIGFVDRTPAPEPTPAAPLHLARGAEAYYDLRYDDARSHLDAGIAEATASGGNGLTTTELSDLFIYRALAHQELGSTTQAWDDFVSAAVIDPTRHLDPARFAPRVVETFQRAVESVRSSPTSALRVDTPPGCTANIDGRPSPAAAVTVRAGAHFVRIDCPDRPAYGTRALVEAPGATIAPALPRRVAPTARAAAELAREHGSKTVLYALVVGESLILRTVDAENAVEKSRVTMSLSTDPAQIARATDSAIEGIVTPANAVVTAPPPPPRPWYRKPWVWGVAGAAVTAAILVPILVVNADSNSSPTFDVRPGGELPPE